MEVQEWLETLSDEEATPGTLTVPHVRLYTHYSLKKYVKKVESGTQLEGQWAISKDYACANQGFPGKIPVAAIKQIVDLKCRNGKIIVSVIHE
jgi:hypothetical protein